MSLLLTALARVIATTPSLAVAAKVHHEATISARVWRAKTTEPCHTDCECARCGEWVALGVIAKKQGRLGDLLTCLRGGARVVVRYVWKGREIERSNF